MIPALQLDWVVLFKPATAFSGCDSAFVDEDLA